MRHSHIILHGGERISILCSSGKSKISRVNAVNECDGIIFFSCHFFISLSQRVMLFLEKFRGESKAQSVYVNCNSAPGKSCPVNHMKFLFSLWHFWNFRAPYAEQFSVGLPYLSPSFNGHLAKSGSRVMQRRKLKWPHQDMGNTPLQSRM